MSRRAEDDPPEWDGIGWGLAIGAAGTLTEVEREDVEVERPAHAPLGFAPPSGLVVVRGYRRRA